jgi:AraC-like DNA-binding protein
METLIQKMPHPEIVLESVEREVTGAEIAFVVDEDKRQSDFNEQNQSRYARLQLWMKQNKAEWTANGFTRDRLCEATGINRQLMLQCLRSQGHNNVHEYITAYRVAELKRMVLRGEVSSLADCVSAGFGSVKTARSCFERIEGSSLDDFLRLNARGKS